MADAYFFVDYVNGNDTSGTGAWNAPTKTLTKAAGASGIFSLSTTGTNYLVVIPSGPCREVFTLGLSPVSGGPLVITGDDDGAYQKSQGSTAPITGLSEVIGWSDDTTALTATATIYATGKSYVTIQNLQVTGSNTGQSASAMYVTGSWSNWTVTNCIFIPHQLKTVTCWFDGTAGAAMNLTVSQCTVIPAFSGVGVEVRPPLHTSEYSLNMLVQNSLFIGNGTGVRFTQTGSGSFLATGVTVQNCGFAFGTPFSAYTGSAVTLTTKLGVYGCYMFGGGLAANNTSVIDENYNDFYATTPRTSVSTGANSRIAANPRVNFGVERLMGLPPRPFMEPLPSSPQLGFGTSGTPPTVDISGRPRPAGGGSTTVAAGAFERHNTAAKETSTVDAGGVGWVIVGPGDDYLEVAVPASATTITLKARYDTNHGSTNKPYVTMRANAEAGVSTQTVTMTAAVDTWETLTVGPFTPTAAGVVRIDLFSRAAAGTGKAFFDTGVVT